MQALTVIENKHYDELLAIVDEGVKTFYEVGMALMEIRENKYYRKTHGTFEALCKERWGFTANYARRLIKSSEVVDNIKSVPMGTIPQSERIVRPLTSLPPELQKEVYRQAVETAPDGKVTAEHIEKTIEDMKMAENANTGSPNQDTPKEDNMSGTLGTIETKEDSKALAHLKSCWWRAKKEDRKAFILWIKEKEEKNGKESEQTSIDYAGYNEAMAS